VRGSAFALLGNRSDDADVLAAGENRGHPLRALLGLGQLRQRTELHDLETEWVGFRNCLAHSVNPITTNIISPKMNLRNAMAQNQTCWTKGQSIPGPHIVKSHAGRTAMTAR